MTNSWKTIEGKRNEVTRVTGRLVLFLPKNKGGDDYEVFKINFIFRFFFQ